MHASRVATRYNRSVGTATERWTDEAPPELFASISNTAGMASNLALAASKGMIVGMAGSFGDAKELAAQKAAEAKKAASNAMGSAMGAMGGKMGGMFGGKK